jgi:hypothetical protein
LNFGIKIISDLFSKVLSLFAEAFPWGVAAMKNNRRRLESGVRHGLAEQFHGQAFLYPSGVGVRFRGVDVSRYGLGCLIIGTIHMRDVLLLNIAGAELRFQVMWAESYLGIDNHHRVGLQCLDPTVDLVHKLTHLGFVTVPIEEDFVA